MHEGSFVISRSKFEVLNSRRLPEARGATLQKQSSPVVIHAITPRIGIILLLHFIWKHQK